MSDPEPIAKMERIFRLSQIFTPGAPVAQRDFFAGRFDQIISVTSALRQPGRQVVLYGERGVGKTSLANILSEVFGADDPQKSRMAARINCTTSDTFTSIWEKAFREAGVPVPEEWRRRYPDPDEIRSILQHAENPPFAIVMDEFDRVEDDLALSLMADTLKALSDHVTPTKLVIVGVAPSIDQLIGEHESVLRAIEQVLMPRMTTPEMAGIIDTGLAAVDMSIEELAKHRITKLAEGLPHYVHLLSLNAAKHALQDDRSMVGKEDVAKAAKEAVESHSLIRDYQVAIQSPRRNNLFSRVLLACALAEKNRLGQFTPASVRDPMSRLMGSHYDIPAFSPHLKAFTQPDRGSILIREGTQRRYTYRFRNPLLQPFTVLAAISDEAIAVDLMKEFLDG